MDLDGNDDLDVCVVGGGACGLTASLRAVGARNRRVVLFEAADRPMSNTSLSGGSLVAGGTKWQTERGVSDTWREHALDVLQKNGGRDAANVEALCAVAPEFLEWLDSVIGYAVEYFPTLVRAGHSKERIHTDPDRKGGHHLIQRLQRAVHENESITYVEGARVTDVARDGELYALTVAVGGVEEHVKCRTVVLACGGYGHNRDLLSEFIPEAVKFPYIGSESNDGDAVLWGRKLGAELRHMGAYQGHGMVVRDYMTRLDPAISLLGGVMVNKHGRRFSREDVGYSEICGPIGRQPGAEAVMIWDQHIETQTNGSESMRASRSVGAYKMFDTVEELAEYYSIPADALVSELEQYNEICKEGRDPHGRTGPFRALVSPLYGSRITASLAHTQGGLRVSTKGEVIDAGTGRAIENLYAGGGAAAGISGIDSNGYLSGNGLLSAIGYGYIIGGVVGSV